MLKSIEQKTIIIMHQLGIPSHLKGYIYLKEAVLIYKENILITKGIYDKLAMQYQVTSGSVERAMRNAIEIGCLRADVTVLENIFGASISQAKGKPTNFEFIATIYGLLN